MASPLSWKDDFSNPNFRAGPLSPEAQRWQQAQVGPVKTRMNGTPTAVNAPGAAKKLGVGKMLGYSAVPLALTTAYSEAAKGNYGTAAAEGASGLAAPYLMNKVGGALSNSAAAQKVIAPVSKVTSPVTGALRSFVTSPVGAATAGGALVTKSLYDSSKQTDAQIAQRTGRTAELADAQLATNDYVRQAQASPYGVPAVPEGADPDEAQPTFEDVSATQNSLRKGAFLRDVAGNVGSLANTLTGLPTDFRAKDQAQAETLAAAQAAAAQKAQAAPSPASASTPLPTLTPGEAARFGQASAATPANLPPPVAQFRAGSIRTANAPHAPDAWVAQNPDNFGAPAGTQVAQKQYGKDKITMTKDAKGRVTFTNAPDQATANQWMAQGQTAPTGPSGEQAARSAQAEKELHYARMASVHGGDAADYAPGGKRDGPSVTSLRGGGDELPWWAGQFDFGRAAMQKQAQQAQTNATLRGQDLQMQQHREQNAHALQIAQINNRMAQEKWGLEKQKALGDIAKQNMELGMQFNPQTGQWVGGGQGTPQQQLERAEKRDASTRAQQKADIDAAASYYDSRRATDKNPGGWDSNTVEAHRTIMQKAYSQVADSLAQSAQTGVLTGPAAAYFGAKEGDTKPKQELQQALEHMKTQSGSGRSPYGDPDFMNRMDAYVQGQVRDQIRGQNVANVAYPAVAGLGAGTIAGLAAKKLPYLRGFAPLVAGTAVGTGAAGLTGAGRRLFDVDKLHSDQFSTRLK